MNALALVVGAAFRLDDEEAQDPKSRLTLLAHRSLSAEFLPFVERLPLRGSMIEKAIPSGGPRAGKPSERHVEPIRRAQEREGLRFGISVPLICQGRLLGGMVLGSRVDRSMSGEERSLLAALEERSRLARERHDSVTQSLCSLTLYAEAAARTLEAGKPKEVADQLRELGDTAREALNSVHEHAGARCVSVDLTLSLDAAALEMSDDGKKFDPEAGRASGGLGLAGMAEKARKVGGELTVQSRPGGGVKVNVRAPLKTSNEPCE